MASAIVARTVTTPADPTHQEELGQPDRALDDTPAVQTEDRRTESGDNVAA